jgi:protocatechuate 3,4-dioxygenase beta subunit
MNRDRASAHEGVQAGAESGFAPRPQTPHQLLGPYFPVGCAPIASGDLTVADGNGAAPRGEIIEVTGRVLTRAGKPVAGARLVIWQANSSGRYAHPNDSNPAPLDPSFTGFSEVVSDNDGAYRIKTVKPGAYPVPSGHIRPPHIHLEVHGKFERLITQMYFPGEPLNASDPVLSSARRPDLLVAEALPLHEGHRAFGFDIVLAQG